MKTRSNTLSILTILFCICLKYNGTFGQDVATSAGGKSIRAYTEINFNTSACRFADKGRAGVN